MSADQFHKVLLDKLHFSTINTIGFCFSYSSHPSSIKPIGLATIQTHKKVKISVLATVQSNKELKTAIAQVHGEQKVSV